MHETDFCYIMCIGTKGKLERGGGAEETHAPALSKKWGGGQVGLYPPTFRNRATPLGSDCQTKSSFSFTNINVIYYCLQNFV